MIIIKQVEFSDINEIMEIDKQAFGNQGITTEMVESQIDIFPEGAFLARENNKIIGIVCCERHKNEDFPPYSHNINDTHFKTGNLLYISVITVEKNFRNKNIGSLFLEKISTFGKKLNMQKIYLPVNKKHPYLEMGVLHFWQKNGYEIKNEIDWEVSSEKVVNAYILEKNI